MTDLLQYNAFGLVKIQRRHIMAVVSFAHENKSPSTRALSNEDVLIEDIDEGETLLVSFGAYLQAGASRLIVYELEKQRDYRISEIPQVRDMIEEITKIAKKAADIK